MLDGCWHMDTPWNYILRVVLAGQDKQKLVWLNIIFRRQQFVDFSFINKSCCISHVVADDDIGLSPHTISRM